MIIYVITTIPNDLVNKIISQMNNKEIITWEYNKKEQGFTHISPPDNQWKDKAYVIFKTKDEKSITFDVKIVDKTKEGVKGIYHGRFAEMLINSFPEEVIESVSSISDI